MSYISQADLLTLVPMQAMIDLSNDDPRAGEVDPVVVDSVIKDACEYVDSYLRGRYSLPLDQPPSLIKYQVKVIARYMLYSRRPDGSDLPDAVSSNKKDVDKQLELLRDGKLSLGIEATGELMTDDGEFKVRVRPASTNTGDFSADVLARY